jgi:hypothetical protein
MRSLLTILILCFYISAQSQDFRKDWADFNPGKWKITFHDNAGFFAGAKYVGDIVFSSGDHTFSYRILHNQVIDSGFLARYSAWAITSQSCPTPTFRNPPFDFQFKEFTYILRPCGYRCGNTPSSACSKFYRKIKRFTLK